MHAPDRHRALDEVLTSSIFNPICHPLVDAAVRDVDSFYLENWNFPDQKSRTKFVAAGFSRVTCLYFPRALDTRIHHACSLLTTLFLIDDQLEHMSLEEGRAYNNSLMPICRGDALPDRKVPVQWILSDLWEKMRASDRALADQILEPLFVFMRAQTSKERLSINDIHQYLEYRQADVGQALLAALMRYAMNLDLSAEELDSVVEIERNCGRHIACVNDIYSYEKEKLTAKSAHEEGAVLCNAVQILAGQARISIESAKQVLWVMCRDWEFTHETLVRRRLATLPECSEALRAYMDGLEHHMSGNELWSRTTKRYHSLET